MEHHTRFYRIAALFVLVALVASALGMPAAIPRAVAAPALPSSTAPAVAVGGSWTFQGPAPELNGQMSLVNVAAAQQQVAGGITAIAASPTNANTIYIGAGNGGVWKTTNATDPNPTWTPLTDNLTTSSSIGLAALAFDPTDATGQTLVAGTAGASGLNVAGANAGLYYTTNGGATWTTITGTSNNLSASGITGVAARGNTLLAGSGNGLFRTTTGPLGTWTKISATGVLPSAAVFSIVADPANTNVLYVTFTGASGGVFKTTDLGATWTNVTSGINVISSATTAFPAAVYDNGTTSVVTVWLNGTVNGAAGNAVFRSVNGAAFTALDVPAGSPKAIIADKTNANLVYMSAYGGVNPGYLAVISRVDASQPSGSQVTLLSGAPITLSGAMTAAQTSVSVGSITLPATPFDITVDSEQMTVTNVVVGTSTSTITVVRGVNGTTAAAHLSGAKVNILPAPVYGTVHSDVYSIGVDASGALLAGSHGGLFRLPAPASPPSATNYWLTANGNLGISEFVSIAYDRISHVFIGGLQDNGSASQTATGSQVWTRSLSSGDGGYINVDNKTLANVPGTTLAATVTSSATSLSVASAAGFPAVTKFLITVDSEKMIVTAINGTTLTVSRGQLGTTAASHSSGATVTVPPQSIRYAGAGLAGFTRFIFDANNTQVSSTGISLSVITDGGGYPPVLINAVDPKRLLFGGGATLYETLDFGGTVAAIAAVGVNNSTQAIAYGGYFNGVANPDILYIGKSSTIYARTTAGGAVTALTLPPPGSGSVQSIVMNPADDTNVFITDNSGHVYVTTTGGTGPQTGAGAAWTNITGNLTSISGTSQTFSIAYVPGATPYIAVGTRNGVFASQTSSLGTWVKLGTGLATAPVYTLIYDAQDNILATGTLGRGLWALSNAAAAFTALNASVTTSSAANLGAKPDVAGKPFGSHTAARQSGPANANGTAGVNALASTCFGPASGQVSCWPGEGNANDAWDGNNGTLQNGATFASGLVGQAFSFDGVDDYVNVPDANNLDFTTDLTIDAWVYQNAQQSGYHVLVGKGRSPTGTGYAMGIGDGKAGIGLNNGSTNCAPADSQTLPLGQWNLIAVTFGSSTAKVYVNGQLRATQPCSFSSLLVSTQPLNIGREASGIPGRNYAGLADEVQVYNRALSLAEIQSIYNAGLNQAPVAVDDSYSTNQDTPLTVAAPGVLANDTDADSDPLTAVKVSDPANGAVTLNSDGSFTYTPNAGFFGSDSFSYTANDTYAASNVATVTMTVNHTLTTSVTGPSSALVGQQITFVFTATDVDPVHQAAGFIFSIDWGDGSPIQIISRAPGDGTARHAYAAAGNYTIQATATDEDGVVSAPASAPITVNTLDSSSLQAVIATTPIVYLVSASDAALHSEVAAINGLSAPASPVDITIVLGDGPYTGVTLSPPDNIVLDLAGNHTADNPGTQITGASPAVTVTSGEVLVQGEGLTTATDSPTVLVSGGHLTIAQDDIEESTGANNVAVALTGGTLTIGLDLYINLNGQGSFFEIYDPDAIGFPDGIDADLTPNTYAVNGTAISASERSATDLESSANPSTFGQAVTFTAGVDVEFDEQGPATGTVTFYDGTTVLGTGTLSHVDGDLFEASFTTSALSVGTHTITAVYGGNAVYLASSAVLTQQVGAFPFAGFFSPVSNPPRLNQVNSGQGVPFAFSLGGDRGLNIIAAGYPVSQQINCTSGAPIGSPQQTTAASPLSYNPATGRYTYTWKTNKAWVNTCRQFTMRLTDGTDHIALFKFK